MHFSDFFFKFLLFLPYFPDVQDETFQDWCFHLLLVLHNMRCIMLKLTVHE